MLEYALIKEYQAMRIDSNPDDGVLSGSGAFLKEV